MTTKRLNFDGPFDMRNISIFYVKELNDLLCEPLQADVKESVKMVNFTNYSGNSNYPGEIQSLDHICFCVENLIATISFLHMIKR